MSKGLGGWQQRVMNTLELSQHVDFTPHRAERDSRGLWHRVHNFDVLLEPHVYDLGVVRRLLARDYGNHHDQAVSRAIRTLIQRGHITPLTLVPIQAYEKLSYGTVPSWLISEDPHGTFLRWERPTVRFATRPSP